MFVELANAAAKYSILGKDEPKYSEEFLDALATLHWHTTPKAIVMLSRAAMGASFALLAVLTLASFLLNWNYLYAAIAAVAIPLLLAHLVTEHPKTMAKIKVLKALGEAPRTLVYLIVLLKQNPSLEEAVRFAASYGEGEISKDFKEALWRVWNARAGSVKDEFPNIGLKWGKYSNDFKRAIYLIRSSLSERFETRRHEVLDRALDASLEGIRAKAKAYVQSLFVPTLILFSFGTILPLMFISLLPVISYFGIMVGSAFEVALLLGAVLLLVYVYSNQVLMSRPPSFSSTEFPESDELPLPGELIIMGRRLPAIPFAAALFVVIAAPGLLFLTTQTGIIVLDPNSPITAALKLVNTLPIIWAFAAAGGVYAYGTAAPFKRIRDESREYEDDVLDGLYHLANRLSENRPPEDSLMYVNETLPNTRIGELFKQTALLVKRRNVTMEQAFFSEKFGTLKGVHSKTVKSIMFLFVNSARKGVKASSEILFTIVDHFHEVRKTEKELNDMMQKSISMLRTTVMVFAPLVCGIVVVMHDRIQSAMMHAQQQMLSMGYDVGMVTALMAGKTNVIDSSVLQLLVGVFIVILSVILVRYIVLIERGPDDVEFKLQLSRLLPLSAIVFTVTLVLTNIMIGG